MRISTIIKGCFKKSTNILRLYFRPNVMDSNGDESFSSRGVLDSAAYFLLYLFRGSKGKNPLGINSTPLEPMQGHLSEIHFHDNL